MAYQEAPYCSQQQLPSSKMEKIKAACRALSQGETLLLIDDATHENIAYVLAAASLASEESIRLIVNTTRGVVMAALSEERIQNLGLPMMSTGKHPSAPDFTVSVEARRGVSTGISAADRAQTLRTLANSSLARRDLVTPGHIFPLRAKTGGLLVRNGPAEAAIDLLNLAGLPETAVLAHCLDIKGALLRNLDIERFGNEHQLPSIRISEITRYRLNNESIIEKIAETSLPLKVAGDFRAICFRSKIDSSEHLALVKGEIDSQDSAGQQIPVLVRVQAESPLSDLFGLHDHGSRERISLALQRIAEAGRGIMVYIRHPRRGLLRDQANLLGNKGKLETTASPGAQLREFGLGAQILAALGAKRIVLLSNTSMEPGGIEAFKIEIVSRQPL